MQLQLPQANSSHHLCFVALFTQVCPWTPAVTLLPLCHTVTQRATAAFRVTMLLFLHSTSQMPDVIQGSYQPVVQRYLPWPLPYTLVVPAVTGTPRTLDACLPPGAVISTHISVVMGWLPAAEALWWSRASGSYLQDPLPCALPCTASFDSCAAALPLPGATQCS